METSQRFIRPAGVGVGGASLQSCDPLARSYAPVLTDLARWAGRGAQPASFPFDTVIAHFQALGRNYVENELLTALRGLTRAQKSYGAGADSAVLASWLPSTVDQADGNYDTYACITLIERVAARGPAAVELMTDVAQVALLADLLMFEADAMIHGAHSADQLRRTKACGRSLLKATDLAPLAWELLSRRPLHEAHGRAQLSGSNLGDLAGEVLEQLPPHIRQLAHITMLPTTAMHDEVMFIRSIQIFELVFRQVARCLQRTVLCVHAGDFPGAVAKLQTAAARVSATGPLYRVLTTMPRDAFAVIRQNTDGRSAIQSKAYQDVEELGERLTEEISATPAELRHAGLGEALADLDRAWRSMKRTHWGITLKIIGRVTGTGGTAGADYLEKSARRPLFNLPGIEAQ
jgi:tryptophan 2,3-dioxygenase